MVAAASLPRLYCGVSVLKLVEKTRLTQHYNTVSNKTEEKGERRGKVKFTETTSFKSESRCCGLNSREVFWVYIRAENLELKKDNRGQTFEIP